MTPELDLFDQLEGGHVPMPIALRIFEDRARLQRALSGFLADGLVEVVDERADPLPLWRWSELCRSEGEWQSVHPRLVIRMTWRGVRYVSGEEPTA